MAFQYSCSQSIECNSYADALALYNDRKPWRRGDANIRPLESRKKKHATVRMLDDKSIAFQLHATDVLTYRPDDSIKIQPYASNSTDAFFSTVTPSNVWAHFTSHIGYMVNINHEWFKISDGAVMRRKWAGNGQWEVDHIPIRYKVVNRKRANEARKISGYDDYSTWAKARRALGAPHGWSMTRPYLLASELLQLIGKGPERWPEVFDSFSSDRVDHCLGLLYDNAKAFDIVEWDSLSGWNEVDRATRALRAWGTPS